MNLARLSQETSLSAVLEKCSRINFSEWAIRPLHPVTNRVDPFDEENAVRGLVKPHARRSKTSNLVQCLLVVCTDVDLREKCCEVARTHGYCVLSAATFEKAISILNGGCIDVIVSEAPLFDAYGGITESPSTTFEREPLIVLKNVTSIANAIYALQHAARCHVNGSADLLEGTTYGG